MTAIAPGHRVTVRADNPLCGDEIELALTLEGGRIVSAAHHARACSLVKASASTLEGLAPGLDLGGARELTDSLARAVRLEGALPKGTEGLAPALLMPARRACVLLPWRALRDALERAR